MRRILVHIPVEPFGEYDIFSKHDNSAFVDSVKTKNGGICPNIGNRLWFQGIVSAIQSEDNSIDYWSPSMNKDFINETYDLIVAPMANVFSVHYISLQEVLAERFRGIKIPVYVIACGVQASSYNEVDTICQVLKKSASSFMSSVYDTGGEFALRGYFTKEFFERLGFSTAVVTGCPSLYQLGKNLEITKEKVSEDAFIPMFNGIPLNYKKHMYSYPQALFFDQDVFWQEIIDPYFFENGLITNFQLKRLIQKWGFDTTRFLLENRIRLFPDMNSWREFIRSNHFSCSFGSRIHGSIMPILSGVPAILECRDARTREIAEFFDIPFVFPEHNNQSLYDLYIDIDYSDFNKNFAEHFCHYENFLRKCGIVDKVNSNNVFFHETDLPEDELGNHEHRDKLYQSLMRKKFFWNSFSYILDIKRKVVSALGG